MFFSRPAGHKYIDRGDSERFDFTVGDFITDNTWRDLDLSSIIGNRAITMILLVTAKADLPEKRVVFRTKGNTNDYNVALLYTQVLNDYISKQFVLTSAVDGKVQYKIDDTTWAAINVLIRGWFI